MLNKICTDLETSKKLKELGVVWDTKLHAVTYGTEFGEFYCSLDDGEFYNEFNTRVTLQVNNYYKAYTLEQILEMLPSDFMDKLGYDQYLYFDAALRAFYYEDFHGRPRLYEIVQKYSENLATTAARLLIKLVEDKIIKIGE